jgi:hypothetical protein
LICGQLLSARPLIGLVAQSTFATSNHCTLGSLARLPSQIFLACDNFWGTAVEALLRKLTYYNSCPPYPATPQLLCPVGECAHGDRASTLPPSQTPRLPHSHLSRPPFFPSLPGRGLRGSYGLFLLFLKPIRMHMTFPPALARKFHSTAPLPSPLS